MRIDAPGRISVLAGVSFLSLSAHAHLTSTGMGPLYDGLMHFVLSPEDLVPAVGLALLCGLRGSQHSRVVLFVLPCAWLLGGLVGLAADVVSGSGAVSAAWFLLVGGLVAADAKLSVRAVVALAAALGLYHGFLNGTGTGHSISAMITVIGLVSAVFVLFALAAALVVQLRRHWARIAIRVIGSWIAASGLLLLGWAIRSV
jgi:hydrogenase/urease accessory protein HupE